MPSFFEEGAMSNRVLVLDVMALLAVLVRDFPSRGTCTFSVDPLACGVSPFAQTEMCSL